MGLEALCLIRQRIRLIPKFIHENIPDKPRPGHTDLAAISFEPGVTGRTVRMPIDSDVTKSVDKLPRFPDLGHI